MSILYKFLLQSFPMNPLKGYKSQNDAFYNAKHSTSKRTATSARPICSEKDKLESHKRMIQESTHYAALSIHPGRITSFTQSSLGRRLELSLGENSQGVPQGPSNHAAERPIKLSAGTSLRKISRLQGLDFRRLNPRFHLVSLEIHRALHLLTVLTITAGELLKPRATGKTGRRGTVRVFPSTHW